MLIRFEDLCRLVWVAKGISLDHTCIIVASLLISDMNLLIFIHEDINHCTITAGVHVKSLPKSRLSHPNPSVSARLLVSLRQSQHPRLDDRHRLVDLRRE
jgi:hypothetical protein